MAIDWFKTGSGPACLFWLNATASRSGNTITVNYTIKAKLENSGSILGTSGSTKKYWIKVKVEAGGASTTVTVKKDNGSSDYDYWSGTTEHTKTGNLTFTDTSTTSTSVKFTGTSGMTSTGKFNTKSMTVSYAAYSTKPGSARNLSVSPTTISTTGSFNASWSAPSSNGGAAINRYELELRRYNSNTGEYSSYTDGSVVVDASGGSIATYKNNVYPSNYYTLNAYDKIYCRLATRNANGWDTTADRPEVVIKICDVPDSIYPTANTDLIAANGYFTLSWSEPSDNNSAIDSYRVQIRKYGSGSSWSTCETTANTYSSSIYPSNYLTLNIGDLVECRVLAHNAAGWNSNYSPYYVEIKNSINIKYKNASGDIQTISSIKYKDAGGNIKEITQVKYKNSSGSILDIS